MLFLRKRLIALINFAILMWALLLIDDNGKAYRLDIEAVFCYTTASSNYICTTRSRLHVTEVMRGMPPYAEATEWQAH